MTRPSYGRFPDETNVPTEILASTVGLEKLGCMIDNSASAVAAVVTTAGGAANSHITVTAKQAGVAGNQLAIVATAAAAPNEALVVTVVDGVLTIALATDGANAITTTATLLSAGINAAAGPAAVFTAAVKAGETGAGVVATIGNTHLSGGTAGDAVTVLAKGTVMAMVTGTGLYVPYNNGDSPAGAGVAVGILADQFDAGLTDQNDLRLAANMWIHGSFVEAKLTGLDAAAKTDLGGRTIGTIFTF